MIENLINMMGVCCVISIGIILVTNIWLLIICKKGQELDIFMGVYLNILPVLVGGLVDALIQKFFPVYTEMVVTLIGVAIVNVLLVITFWPWRESKSDQYLNF